MSALATPRGGRRLFGRVLTNVVWCYGAWVLLTWSRSPEVLAVGAVVSASVAVALAPLGEVVRPWALLRPRRAVAVLLLLSDSLWRIVRANVSLARRIWTPSLPLASGMVIVPTEARTDRDLAGVGLVTSLIVDNQIVDLDRSRDELLFHCVEVPAGGPQARRAAINGPTERRLADVEGRHG